MNATTITGVELLEIGTWPCSTGEFTWTTLELQAAIDALACPAIRTPHLKLGHVDPRFDGEPQVGQVHKLRLSADGSKLVGDYVDLPGRFGSIVRAAYPGRSIEGEFNYRCGAGDECPSGGFHAFVITAVALLGTTEPAVWSLADIEQIYAAAPHLTSGGVPVVVTFAPKEEPMPKVVKAAVRIDAIYEEFRENLPEGSWAYIDEVWIGDGAFIIVIDDDGELWRIPYTESNGDIAFAAPEKVAVQYVPAPADDESDDQTIVLAARNRGPKTVAASAAAKPAKPAEKGGLVEVTDKIREALGLADDVTEIDEDTFLAKLGEIKDAAKPADPPKPDKPAPLPEGVVAIDESTLEDLKVAASRGNAAHETLRKQTRDAFLTGAVQAGKFAPSRREHFATLYDADEEGTRTLIASLAANTVPVTELGNAGTDVTSDDALYAAIYPERFKESSNG